MVFQPFVDIWTQVVALKPGFLSKTPHFNFITVHYFWIIGNTIVGSILLYPAGNMAYIDALFFASGVSTQSGLNTIDVNQLNSYQQAILFILPFWCNPITINSFVVFLRLYWFEKRFQHVAKEAKRNRRTISKTRSQMRGERDVASEEKGVDGRRIVVMHDTAEARGTDGAITRSGPDGFLAVDPDRGGEKLKTPDPVAASGSSKGGSTTSEDAKREPTMLPHPAQIKFADHVIRSDGMGDEPLRTLAPWMEDDHIAVLERQRNPDKGVLRIPGPRDAERGAAPETLEEEEALRQRRNRKESTFEPRSPSQPDGVGTDGAMAGRSSDDAHGPQRAVTIREPHRPQDDKAEDKVHAAVQTLGVFKFRIPRLFNGLRRRKGHSPSPFPETGSFSAATSREKSEMVPYLSWQPTVGRNSAFVDLTEQQREELGGIEYRSLKALAMILVLYFWGFTFLGFIGLIPWILSSDRWGPIVDGDGAGRTWWGFFTATSAFNDVGYTLTPDSMISFQSAIWPLLLMTFLIIIGNTGFPIMLRAIIWITSKYVPKRSGIWEELQFLLDHPRRCFTLLFPSKATWWLFWILVILNGVDLVFFIILDLGNDVVTELPVNIRVLDGWFQAVSTRTAGLACVDLANLHPAIQASYMIMMYISVLPIAISVRRTNVYEEKSLGLYGSPGEDDEEEEDGEPSYIGAHVRRQLSFDLWYIFLGFFIITISEGQRLQSGDPAFTMFTVLFEVVSAYGTVGLSLGYTTVNASFSSQFGVIGKLVIIAMEIRGRHRGLPYELDRAILLPSESLHDKEDSDAAARVRRRSSVASTVGMATGVDANRGGGGGDGTNERGRSRERPHQPSLLSRIMHPGPVVAHHLHEGERKIRSKEEALMTRATPPYFNRGLARTSTA